MTWTSNTPGMSGWGPLFYVTCIGVLLLIVVITIIFLRK